MEIPTDKKTTGYIRAMVEAIDIHVNSVARLYKCTSGAIYLTPKQYADLLSHCMEFNTRFFGVKNLPVLPLTRNGFLIRAKDIDDSKMWGYGSDQTKQQPPVNPTIEKIENSEAWKKLFKSDPITYQQYQRFAAAREAKRIIKG